MAKVETPFLIDRNGLVNEEMALDLLRQVQQMAVGNEPRRLTEREYVGESGSTPSKLTALITTDFLPIKYKRIDKAWRFLAQVENPMNRDRKKRRGLVTIYVDQNLIKTVNIDSLGLVSLRSLETAA